MKNIGLKAKQPEKSCKDRKCPFHGDIKVRGRTFVGKVVTSLAKNTATVTWERRHKMPKYERYETRKTKITVHNPECINAKKDDQVRIAECRPLSKTKRFVIIENLGKLEEVRGEEDKSEEKKEAKTGKDAKKDEKKARKSGD